jgi:hypothetical protein
VILKLEPALLLPRMMALLVTMATLVLKLMSAKMVIAVEKTQLFAKLKTNVTMLVIAIPQLENAQTPRRKMDHTVMMAMPVLRMMFANMVIVVEKTLLFAKLKTNVTMLVFAIHILVIALIPTHLMALLATMETLVLWQISAELEFAVVKMLLSVNPLINVTMLVFVIPQLELVPILPRKMDLIVTMETCVLKLMSAKVVIVVEKTPLFAKILTNVSMLVCATLILVNAWRWTNLMVTLVMMAMLVPRPMFAEMETVVERILLFVMPLINVTMLVFAIPQPENAQTPRRIMVPLVTMVMPVLRLMFATTDSAVVRTLLPAKLKTNVTMLVFAKTILELVPILPRMMDLIVTM